MRTVGRQPTPKWGKNEANVAVNDRSARWSLTATPLKCGSLLTRSSFFQRKKKITRRRELGSALLQWPTSKTQNPAVERQAVFVRKSGRSANAGIGRGVRLARPSHKPRPTAQEATQARILLR